MKRLFVNVVMVFDGVPEPNGMLCDVMVANNGSYEVNKMVFKQKDLETKEESWVVFPEKHYRFRLEVMKDTLEAEIFKAQTDPNYAQESQIYEKILNDTTKPMNFQDGH